MVETGRFEGGALIGFEDGLGVCVCVDGFEKRVDTAGGCATVEGFDLFVVSGSFFSSVAGRFDCRDVL